MMRRYNRNKRHNRMNYVNLANGDYLETTRQIGWIMRNGKWIADYADKLEWYQKEDGFWIQRYIKEKVF
jgi:hypothetical protein